MSEYAITANELVKQYGKKTAINRMSLQLHAGELIGLIGANGSGKTSLMKMCVGLEDITSGTIQVLGANPLEDMGVRSEILYSMHDLPVGDRERLESILRNYGILYPHFDRAFADKLMELFQLPKGKRYKALSQGMKSLFHFVCALASRCQVTLLDEPFIGIDIERRKLAYDILLRDYMEHPRTFVVSSHNLSELEGILSEMVLIHDGRFVFYETMDAVREMLFQADGDRQAVQVFAEGLPEQTVVEVTHGETGSSLIAHGSAASEAAGLARRAGLTVRAVSPEDVTIYMAGRHKKKELSYLWEEQ